MSKLLKVAWFGTKAGIGAGAVYLTVNQGVWGDNQSTAAVYDKLYDVMPATKSVSEKYLHLPKTEVVNVNFRSYWNTGIFYTFDFIANLPSKVGSVKNYVVDTVSDFASSPPASAAGEDKTTDDATPPPDTAKKE